MTRVLRRYAAPMFVVSAVISATAGLLDASPVGGGLFPSPAPKSA